MGNDIVKRLLSIGENLEVWEVKKDGDICVSYKNGEAKGDGFLIGYFGRGKTFEEACLDYMNKISGKTLVFNAYTDRRKEVTVL